MSKKEFSRGIDDEFVTALNRAYEDSSWWKKLIDDKSLFLGIRDDHIHIYFKGARILELRHRSNELVGHTHFKYLINLTRDDDKRDLVDFIDGTFDAVKLDESYRDIGINLGEIKNSAKTYHGEEKMGVHEIITHNKNVIDTEIQLPGEERRIDFAALRQMDGKVRVVFYEAKTYSNGEIRSRDRPKVLDQIESYGDIISARKTEIEEAYKHVAGNIHDICGWNNRRCSIFGNVSINNLAVDPRVRLVIFGFDDAQKKDAERENGVFGKLRKFLGEDYVLTKGRSQKFVRGIRSL